MFYIWPALSSFRYHEHSIVQIPARHLIMDWHAFLDPRVQEAWTFNSYMHGNAGTQTINDVLENFPCRVPSYLRLKLHQIVAHKNGDLALGHLIELIQSFLKIFRFICYNLRQLSTLMLSSNAWKLQRNVMDGCVTCISLDGYKVYCSTLLQFSCIGIAHYWTVCRPADKYDFMCCCYIYLCSMWTYWFRAMWRRANSVFVWNI